MKGFLCVHGWAAELDWVNKEQEESVSRKKPILGDRVVKLEDEILNC